MSNALNQTDHPVCFKGIGPSLKKAIPHGTAFLVRRMITTSVSIRIEARRAGAIRKAGGTEHG